MFACTFVIWHESIESSNGNFTCIMIFSPLSIMQYVGLYVFSLLISPVMIERIYIYFVLLPSSNRKYELLPIV